MKSTLLLPLVSLSLAAQSNELALLLGRLNGVESVSLGSGTALQVNYARRFAVTGPIQFFAGVNLTANPQRKLSTNNQTVIRDLASLYVTPEIQCKLGEGRIRPYAFLGGGLAVHEHSLLTTGGAPNPGPRTANTGALTYGAGADLGITGWLALRGEFRDTYSGAPTYNIAAVSQHNTSVTGGFVLRWGR